MRKLMLGCIVCLAGTLSVIAPSAFAQSLSACQLQGAANFSPGLTLSSQRFEYSFGGTLSGCESSQSGVPTSGTIEAGQTLTEQVTNSITGATDTVTYQEPLPWGEGSCASSKTVGSLLETWSDGTHTVVTYSTRGALDGVVLSGQVASSMTLPAVNAQEGDPLEYTIKTNRFAVAEMVDSPLLFQPSEPTACNSSTGATTAGINGAVSVSQSLESEVP